MVLQTKDKDALKTPKKVRIFKVASRRATIFSGFIYYNLRKRKSRAKRAQMRKKQAPERCVATQRDGNQKEFVCCL